MSFVDSDEAHLYVPELGSEEGGRQAFGGYIQELGISEDAVLKNGDNLLS